MFRKTLAALFALLGLTISAWALGDRIRTLELVCLPPGEDLAEYRATLLFAEKLREIGLDVVVHPLPYAVEDEYIWFKRDRWDMTAWYMTSRAERSDPDELLYNGFISTAAEAGYNFYGYINPYIDELLEAQRRATDPLQRQAIIWEIQRIIAEDVPIVPTVYLTQFYAYNKKLWDPSTLIDQPGLGIRNYWSFVRMSPLTKENRIIANYVEDVLAINPLWISGVTDMWIVELVFDRLMRVGPEGLPVPSAAEKVTWLDETTVDIILKKNLRFHDGTPITAEDVKFSFEAIMSGEAPSYEPFVRGIKSIQVLSPLHLRFYLVQPNVAFMVTTLSKICIIPKHIWAPIIEEIKLKPEDASSVVLKEIVGSGPYRLVKWERGGDIVLEPVKDHYDAPQAAMIIFRKVAIPEVAVGQLLTEELNFLTDYRGDPTVLKEVVAQSDFLEWQMAVTLGVRFFAFNLRRQPFNDRAFRQALAYLVPRSEIVSVVEQGFAVPADSIISSVLKFWHNPNLPQYDYDLAKAKEILIAAGYGWDSEGRLCYPEGTKETLSPAWGP